MSDRNTRVLRDLLGVLSIGVDEALLIFGLGGLDLEPPDLGGMTRTSDPIPFPDEVLARFLDGLITHKRGPRDPSKPPIPVATELSNNDILKKLRIALKLHEDEMLATFEAGGKTMSAPELKALFRRDGHKGFTTCDDETLQHFLDGLGPH